MGGGEEWVSGVITQVACGFQLNPNPGLTLKDKRPGMVTVSAIGSRCPSRAEVVGKFRCYCRVVTDTGSDIGETLPFTSVSCTA